MDGFIFVDFEITFFTSLILQSSRKNFLAISILNCIASCPSQFQGYSSQFCLNRLPDLSMYQQFILIWLFHLAPLFKSLILRLFTSNSITYLVCFVKILFFHWTIILLSECSSDLHKQHLRRWNRWRCIWFFVLWQNSKLCSVIVFIFRKMITEKNGNIINFHQTSIYVLSQIWELWSIKILI